jgi:hypothetical protein
LSIKVPVVLSRTVGVKPRATKLVLAQDVLATLFTEAIAGALRRRGVPEPAASLVAGMGMLAFRMAFRRWLEPGNDRGYADLARQALQELRTAAAALD